MEAGKGTAAFGDKRRVFASASLGCTRAARRKGATGRKVEWAWRFAQRRFELCPQSGVGNRDRIEKRSCIGVSWQPEYVLDRTAFNDSSQIHDENARRHDLYDREIVGNQQVAKIEALLQIL
jgi:hypothetical protein